MNKRSLVCLLAVLTMLLASVVSAAEISIVVDGKTLTPADVPAQLINDRTMVPLRFIGVALGAEVGYDAKTNTAIVRKGVQLGLDINKAAHGRQDMELKLEINGKLVDAQLVNVNDRVLVPLRIIGETLNADVGWDEANNRVIINKKIAPVVAADPMTTEAFAILTKANDKLAKLPGYTFQATGSTMMTSIDPSAPGEIKIDQTVLGACQGSDKVYVKSTTLMSGLPMSMPEMVMEMVIDMPANVIYIKAPGTDLWQKAPAAGLAEAAKISPEQSIQMLKDAGIQLTYENTTDNGQSYLLIKGEMDGDKLYAVVKDLIGQMLPQDVSTNQEAAAMVEETMKSLHGTFTYWVNAQDYTMVKADTEITASIKTPAGTMPITSVMSATYGTGEVTIPTITPEMIAPAAEIKKP